MKVVILAAGLGSRLWPLSTPDKPKQFQPLIDGESLLKYTYSQLSKIFAAEDLYVQVLKGLEATVYEQLPGIDASHIILVPEHRDTLAETLWAINLLSKKTNEPILFKSVDQYLADASGFLSSLESCLGRYDYAQAPITLLCSDYSSYSANSGYLTADDTWTVTKFIEKPTKDVVEALLKNSAVYRSLFIYIASYQALLDGLSGLDQSWAKLSKQLLQASPSQRQKAYLSMPIIDISSTLFQTSKSLKLATIGHSYNFLDVGRYSALYELNEKDDFGNVLIGKVVLGKDCHNNFIINQTDSPLVVTSISDSVVVQTPFGSLISSMDGAGHIGEIYKNKLY